MSATSEVLAQLVRQYITSVSAAAGQYRLVVPGLTPRIGEDLHTQLMVEGVHSFLVISRDRMPDEARRWLLPVSLTTMRIGSFVAIADPGALADIRDSIRGSGGAIRSTAFSEEWPWISDGSEAFHFAGPFLSALLERWTSSREEKKWLRQLLVGVLIDATRRDPNRAVILLEDILGAFRPSNVIPAADVREQFLFHCGIPKPADVSQEPARLARDTRSLIKKIMERMRSEPGLRAQVHANVSPQDPDEVAIHAAVDDFFDGLASTATLTGDVLSLRTCWGSSANKAQNWQLLTSQKLRQLFEVQEQRPVELRCVIEPVAGILVGDDGRTAAGHADSVFTVSAHYDIPPEDFSAGSCRLAIAVRSQLVEEHVLTSASGEVQVQVDIHSLGISYRSRIPVRAVVSVGADERGVDRLFLHCCGEQRPAFVVVTPHFWVDDADEAVEGDPAPERRHPVDSPVRLHFFSSDGEQPSVVREDGDQEQLVQNAGVWGTADTIDVFGQPAGQMTCECEFGTRNVTLSFEAEDIERGEFTLEDELRQSMAVGRKEKVREILAIHGGTSRDPYARLGGLTDQTRRRIRLARCFEDRVGWRPILADLLGGLSEPEVACGDYALLIGETDASAITGVTLPEVARQHLERYADQRDAFRQTILASLHRHGTTLEHPDYAMCPFYLSAPEDRRHSCEEALGNYLRAFANLQTYLRDNLSQLTWPQVFILSHLDCIVQWRDDGSKNAFFLVGPWHPLVAAKRYFVQRALVLRAHRLIDDDDKSFHELVGLLSQISGFYWLPSVKADDVATEPAYVTPTSDPGWHFAFKRRSIGGAGTPSGSSGMLPQAVMCLKTSLNLDLKIHLPASGAMVGTVLSGYARTFPSKRHLGVYFPSGFAGEEEVRAADIFLHAEEGPTAAGLQLPGGINLSFSDSPLIPEDASWASPPLKVFHYEDRRVCVEEQHPDLQFCQANDRLDFLEVTEAPSLPRGSAYGVVFAQGLSRLTLGQSFVPQSVCEEWDHPRSAAAHVGDLFVGCCGQACTMAGRPHGLVYATSLPQRLDTTWTVVPGVVLDPAVFVEYVRGGRDRQFEERALWDYRVSLCNANSSFFVLSTIPTAFRSAVNGLFGDGVDRASEFVTELGGVGLAIAGEAMKSGRHALGAVGVVGAVRLFAGGSAGSGPVQWTSGSVGFLLPVDSFREILEGRVPAPGEGHQGERHRRADLLAVIARLPVQQTAPLLIQAVAVECKFASGTFPDVQVQPALEQAAATTEQFRRLCNIAATDAGIPERMAFLQLLRFGMRVTGSQAERVGLDQRIAERTVYELVLRGQFEFRSPNARAVLVSTEMGLPGPAEVNRRSIGLWLRLNQTSWPGVAETPSIADMRWTVASIFELPGGGQSQTVPSEVPPSEPSSHPPVTAAAPRTSEQSEPQEPSTERLEPPTSVIEPAVAAAPTPQQPQGAVLRSVLVGVDASRRSVYFDPHSPIDRLDNANIMVTGSSGKGKTQLLKYLITAIRDQGANTLVLDFKNDFANDRHFVSRAGLNPILVAFDGMPFNPLIPYPITDPRSGRLFVQCAQHIAGISAVLRRTYGLGPQQEAAVKNAIRQAFSEGGVDPATTTLYDPAMTFPDLARVGEILEQTNIGAYNRLDPLFTLGLFREQFWRVSFASMVTQSAALDFSQIPSDALKNALAELVVLSAHSYFNSQPHCGALRQVFVVDEAHRVLSADYLERFALECRAYGVSLLLSSQYPSHFPAGISASLATKIVHGNDRDVDRVRDIVNLLGCAGREAEIAELGMFEAVFSNKHFRNVIVRTITYPLHLVLTALTEFGELTREQIGHIDGIDVNKLSVGNLIRHLERLGLCETIDGRVRLVRREA